MTRLAWNRKSGRRARGAPCVGAGLDHAVPSPPAGAYVTDGAALFRVEHPLVGDGELLIELQDCYTLELVLCPASSLDILGLRTVTPTPET